MVKYTTQVVRDAHYESQMRTLEVSNKPFVGKEMFSSMDAGGSFQGTFETERFIHGKIRDLNGRNLFLSGRDASASPQTGLNWSRVSTDEPLEIHDSLMYRAAAESIDHAVGKTVMSSIPKQLRAYVLAQLIQDSEMSVMNYSGEASSVKVDRAQLQARLRMRRGLKLKGFNNYDGGDLRMKIDGLLMAAAVLNGVVMESSKVTSAKDLSSMGIHHSSAGITLSPLHLLEMASKCMMQGFDASKCLYAGIVSQLYAQGSRSTTKLIESQKYSSTNTVSRVSVESRIEEGFGTAPIWYQQAMATGPPLTSSRWKRPSSEDEMVHVHC